MPRPAPPTALAARRPLSVRSAVLSVLLGCYPEAVSARSIVATGRRLGLGESAVRAALSRAVGAGDLERTDGGYRIGARLLARFEEQDEAIGERPHTSSDTSAGSGGSAWDGAWDGAWETAFVVSSARAAADRAALRAVLGRHRLAELREGVWLRPANLRRPATYADHPDLRTCVSRHDDPVGLAGELWDLAGWAGTAHRLLSDLDTAGAPADRLTAAAVLVRHLRTDPLLPAALLPTDWPGDALRSAYADYQAELRELAASV